MLERHMSIHTMYDTVMSHYDEENKEKLLGYAKMAMEYPEKHMVVLIHNTQEMAKHLAHLTHKVDLIALNVLVGEINAEQPAGGKSHRPD